MDSESVWDDIEDFDDTDECVGCCDNCECNLYEDDVYFRGPYQFCGQCYWSICGGPSGL